MNKDYGKKGAALWRCVIYTLTLPQLRILRTPENPRVYWDKVPVYRNIHSFLNISYWIPCTAKAMVSIATWNVPVARSPEASFSLAISPPGLRSSPVPASQFPLQATSFPRWRGLFLVCMRFYTIPYLLSMGHTAPLSACLVNAKIVELLIRASHIFLLWC